MENGNKNMKDILITIKHICIGWYRRLFKKQSQLAKDRLAICDKCEFKKRLLGDDICDLCGCFIAAKVLVEDEICYANKW